MTKEKNILLKIYCNVFGVKILGTMENDNEYALCDWMREDPKPENIWFKTYDEILDFLEKNINKIGPD